MTKPRKITKQEMAQARLGYVLNHTEETLLDAYLLLDDLRERVADMGPEAASAYIGILKKAIGEAHESVWRLTSDMKEGGENDAD